jgi:Ca-activated chloride channel family protein
MVIPLIILGFFIVTNKRYIDRIFDSKVLKKLIIRRNYLGIFGKNILLFLALFLFIIALSRPVSPKDEVKLHSKVPSFAILLDISASMRASDIYPNRLTFAKKKIDKLLQNQTAKISLYTFSDNLYQIASKTTDLEVLRYLVKHLDIPIDLSKSSNLFIAIKNIKEKNIIIFTDGTDIKDFSKIKALKKNITIYLTATKNKTPIKMENGYLKNRDGEIVLTSANFAIKEIGRVIPFSYKDSDMKTLITSSNSITFSIKEFKELYHYPLYLATIALFFAFFSPK